MTQSITDIVFKTLSRHFELTTNGVYKHCADQPGITNMKSVANALERLRKHGKATSYRCKERGIYLWQAVKPIQQAVDPTEESLDTVDDQSADASHMMGEMASDVAEIERPNVQKNLTVADADMVATLNALDTERESQERQAVSETVTIEPVSVEVKVTHKPLTPRQLLDAFEESGESFQGDLCDFRLFSAGAEFAEKHHGISQ